MAEAQRRHGGVNLQVLHERLVRDHEYTGSYKSVQRYVRARFPRPKVRIRRRVETPPGGRTRRMGVDLSPLQKEKING